MIRKLALAAISIFLLAALGSAGWSAPSAVKVVRDGEKQWHLEVDGQPFFVKGVGCNEETGEKGEDYLAMARDMGANAVRTWGGARRSYLDKAQQYGLKVNLGFWLNAIRDGSPETYKDPGHCAGLKSMILSYVDEMKDHPALLSWNIGNEVFAFTDDAAEREAFGRFLEEIIQAIHQADPAHPVVYASASGRDIPDLQKYVPSLDILGINNYASLSMSMSPMDRLNYDKPILVTEFGATPPWDSGKDSNGLPFDASDSLKASAYLNQWRQIQDSRPRCVGGFAFVLGNQRNSESLTWNNINLDQYKRPSYWALYRAYTGHPPERPPLGIKFFHVEESTGVAPGAQFAVAADASGIDPGSLNYHYLITDIFSDPLALNPPRFFPTDAQVEGPGRARLRAPNEPGLYRVYVWVEDGKDSAAVADHSLRVLAQ